MKANKMSTTVVTIKGISKSISKYALRPNLVSMKIMKRIHKIK